MKPNLIQLISILLFAGIPSLPTTSAEEILKGDYPIVSLEKESEQDSTSSYTENVWAEIKASPAGISVKPKLPWWRDKEKLFEIDQRWIVKGGLWEGTQEEDPLGLLIKRHKEFHSYGHHDIYEFLKTDNRTGRWLMDSRYDPLTGQYLTT